MLKFRKQDRYDKIKPIVEKCLQQYGFEYKIPESGHITMVVQPGSKPYRVLIWVEEDERLLNIIVGGIVIPENKRQICLEFIARANHVNKMGCFDFDFDDGTTMFRDCINVTGGNVTVEMVRQMLLNTVAVFDKHFNALEYIVSSEITAINAHKHVAPEYYH